MIRACLSYHSKLAKLLVLLGKVVKDDQYVRVIGTRTAGIKVEALRHWIEELAR